MYQALFVYLGTLITFTALILISIAADVKRRARARRGKRTMQELLHIIAEVIG